MTHSIVQEVRPLLDHNAMLLDHANVSQVRTGTMDLESLAIAMKLQVCSSCFSLVGSATWCMF